MGCRAVNGMIFRCYFFRAFAQARPHVPFYFWLNPKVTKDQEPIKGDFSFAKPRSLLPLHAFIAGLTNSAFLFLFCIVQLSAHFISSAIPTIAIPLVAPHINGDGFDPQS
jgi:hypothetical protein